MFLDFALQIGWVLKTWPDIAVLNNQNGMLCEFPLKKVWTASQTSTTWKVLLCIEINCRTDTFKSSHLWTELYYLISFVSCSFHLFIDPAFQLIRVPEELLQVEWICKLRTAAHGPLVQSITPAQKLEKEGEIKELFSLKLPFVLTKCPQNHSNQIVILFYSEVAQVGMRYFKLTASLRVATSSLA